MSYNDVDKIYLEKIEHDACFPAKPDRANFNKDVVLPHGLTIDHVAAAMDDFVDFPRIWFQTSDFSRKRFQKCAVGAQ